MSSQWLVKEGGEETYFESPSAPFLSGNVAFFCPFCGEIWARELRTDVPEPQFPSWISLYASCTKCPPRHREEIPGSLFRSAQSIPDSLLEREFFIHVNYLRRYIGEANYQEIIGYKERGYDGPLAGITRRGREGSRYGR